MIFGGEKIGYSVAEILQETKSVRLVDKRREKSEEIAAGLSNTMVINADATDIEFLTSDELGKLAKIFNTMELPEQILFHGLLEARENDGPLA